MRYLTLIFLLFAALGAIAQKLPNKQETSVWAPANIKIDGKANEWNNQFNAHNKTTNISYTLANDADNLYLIAQVTEPRIIEKLLYVGIKLTINNAGKKDYKAPENISINYPVLKQGYQRDILRNAGDKANWSGIPPQPRGSLFPETLTGTDSTLTLANKALLSYANSITVTGVKELPDSVISIYNDQHIRVAAMFDSKGVYTYELSIPLKYLGISTSSAPKIAYSIKLKDHNSGGTVRGKDPVTNRYNNETIEVDSDLDMITDFWADYTLAKAP